MPKRKGKDKPKKKKNKKKKKTVVSTDGLMLADENFSDLTPRGCASSKAEYTVTAVGSK